MKKSMGKRIAGAALAAALALGAAACGGGPAGDGAAAAGTGGFRPALDTDTACEIRVAGHYSNFEALEAEFDRFSAYYPKVELSYTALDNYNSAIGAALNGGEPPNIYCTFPWMLDKERYDPLFEAAEDLSDPALGIDLSCVRAGLLHRDAAGGVRMVPVLSTTYGMLVNDSLLEREGLSVPDSYASLLSACAALKAAGYDSPVMGYNDESNLFYAMALPLFYASVGEDAALAERLNALEPASAGAIRPVLALVEDFVGHGCVDLDLCGAEITDSYQSMILRFFEGDVPMMFTTGDCASGTSKREPLSEAFSRNPFPYSFHPIPTTERGGYFLNMGAVEFSVNRHCDNLDMTNEFMRFLISTEELNEMARVKRLVTASTDLSLDGVYAAFAAVEPDHVIYEKEIGLLDAPMVQMRRAAWQVGNGWMSIDEAIAAFGSLEG